MRMFDSFLTYIIITILSIGVAVVNLFLIYAIWKHSPKSMGKFKPYMMKMSIADLLFASSIAFLFLPNLLFPLPAGVVTGLLKYCGPSGGPIAYCVSVMTGGSMMASMCQCCMYRLYVFYRLDWILEVSVKYFTFLQLLESLLIFLVIVPLGYYNTATYQELADYAKRHGYSMPTDITLLTPMAAFDLDKWNVIIGVFIIGGFLFLVGALNGISNAAVHKKITQTKASMSKESYKMQRSLTMILLAQAIIPGVSIAIPILIYCVAIFFFLEDVLRSPIMEWFSVLIIGAYPFINSSFCLYYMKPYRQFTKIIIRRVIWCYHWSDEVIIIAEPTGSSSNPS